MVWVGVERLDDLEAELAQRLRDQARVVDRVGERRRLAIGAVADHQRETGGPSEPAGIGTASAGCTAGSGGRAITGAGRGAAAWMVIDGPA